MIYIVVLLFTIKDKSPPLWSLVNKTKKFLHQQNLNFRLQVLQNYTVYHKMMRIVL